MTMLARCISVALGVVTASALLCGPAAAAPVDRPWLIDTARVTLTSSVLPPYPFSGSTEFDPTNVRHASGNATTSSVGVELSGGTVAHSLFLEFDAPEGQTLHTGLYYGDDAYNGAATHGNGRIALDSQSCPAMQFTIQDIASSGSAITRLDVRFQTTCTGLSNVNATIFGELQLGEPQPSATIVTGTRSISWPDVPVGVRSEATVPVVVRNTGADTATVGSLALHGRNADEFPVLSDDCSHRSLGAGASCTVVLAFAPTDAGTRTASVVLPVGALRVSTTLRGTGTPGTTLLSVTRPSGGAGQGSTSVITDAMSQMQVLTSRQFTAFVPSGDWQVTVTAPTRRGIQVGTFPTNRFAEPGSTYGLDVTEEGAGCDYSTGTITIRQVHFAADGAPSAFDMSFSRTTCDSSTAALTGRIEYHATA